MTRIGLIRHGITDWNIERRAQGQTDIPLNHTGRLQAHALADRLKNEEWDFIFSSDLSRAKETADIIAEPLGLTVQTDHRLREMHCGEIEGTTLEERITKWGEDWEGLPLGIEEDNSIIDRGTSSITEISESFEGKRILIVSHGALIGLTLRRLIPNENTEKHLHNTSITILKQNNSEWDCELYNCAKHIL
jgi:probable phosphoglycerate mutase